MSTIARNLISFFLIILFLFLRLYNINNSFFFFNDMGRDMVVLQEWHDTGKLPLLGPQNSVLPFNQSAIYFYLLYAGFSISHGSPISSLYTLNLVYIITFILGLYLLRKDKKITNTLMVIFFLVSINPQYISQSRYVWNPSFVGPFVIFAIISFYLLLQKFSWPKIWIFSGNIALALSFSYSVFPLLIAFFIYWLIFNRQKFLPYFFTLISSIVFFNLPTIIFELRHHFLLTTSLLSGKTTLQDHLSLTQKLTDLSQYIFMTPYQTINIILLIGIILLFLYLIFKKVYRQNSLTHLAVILFLLLALQILIIPVTVRTQYIFPFISLIFIFISSLNNLPKLFSLIFLSFIYLQPSLLNSFFQKAPRTYQEMSLCFQKFCRSHPQSTFVSVQSNYHPYHNGPEHRYLLQKSDCQVKDVETESGQSKFMAVVLDNGTFDSKTNYYELNLFGKYKDTETFDCLPNFKIKVLEKL